MSQWIQKYQGSDEALLSKFVKVEVLKGKYVFQVFSWSVRNLSSFKRCQDYPHKSEQRWLVHNKKNILNSIFVHFT